MHFALRVAVDITGARRTCNVARRDADSLYLSFFPAVITLGDDSVVIVILIVISIARRILSLD